MKIVSGIYILQTTDMMNEHTKESLLRDNKIFANSSDDVLIEVRNMKEYEIPSDFQPPFIPKQESIEEQTEENKTTTEGEQSDKSHKQERMCVCVCGLNTHSFPQFK
jgi:hypothetical protein